MFFKTFIIQSQTTESLPPPAPRDLLLRSRLVRLLLGSHLPVRKKPGYRPEASTKIKCCCLNNNKYIQVIQ